MALLKFLLLFMQPLQGTSIHLQMDDMKASMQYSPPEEINNIWELEHNIQNDHRNENHTFSVTSWQ